MLGELMAVVGTFNRTNKLADGYQVTVDDQLLGAARGAAPARPGEPALRQNRVASRKAQRPPKTRTRARAAGRDPAAAAAAPRARG